MIDPLDVCESRCPDRLITTEDLHAAAGAFGLRTEIEENATTHTVIMTVIETQVWSDLPEEARIERLRKLLSYRTPIGVVVTLRRSGSGPYR
jgi:hypothetical protein